MLIKKPQDIAAGEITPPEMYLNRRAFLKAGVLVGSVMATGWLYKKLNTVSHPSAIRPRLQNVVPATQTKIAEALQVTEDRTPFETVTHFNNFYEFSEGKEEVADAAKNFVARPWAVEVGGLVGKPKTFDIDDLLKISPPEERVYRMRCVERWSMVIPWDGFSLSKLLDRVQPLSGAKYVAFESLLDPERMPGQKDPVLQWPYVEGLRMDEAMHPLTILASGVYGQQLPPQDGAPVRLVVPWKYGFKGIKSIVKITLTADEPPTSWSLANPPAYGFYANVNPQVDRPWSQDEEQRLDSSGSNTRETLMFNGYEEQVGSLYNGMDLDANF